MNGHCCTCGAKRSPKWRELGWMSLRINRDPVHQLCRDCLDKIDAIDHARQYGMRKIGCRIDDNPNAFNVKTPKPCPTS